MQFVNSFGVFMVKFVYYLQFFSADNPPSPVREVKITPKPEGLGVFFSF